MTTNDSFAASYAEARAKFRAAVREAGAVAEAVPHPLRGPDGGALATDIAWIGAADAQRVLVLQSGIHGVEGFCGSGAQVDWLRRREFQRLPPAVAVLMIHAVNPYGFAWLRRVNEDNVDLNRNFMPFGTAALPVNHGYEDLRAALSPERFDAASEAAARQAMIAYARTHGREALARAAAGGQYVDPKGIFYGGAGPVWSNRTLHDIYVSRLAAAHAVCVLDFHTGLGPAGYAEQIVIEGPGDPPYKRARDWFGAAVVSMAAGKSSAAELSGDNLAAVAAWLPGAEVTALAMEYGTVSPEETLQALRADNWLHMHGDPAAADAAPIKAALRDAFYVDRDDWRGMIAGQSLMTCRQAIAGLAES